MQHCNSASKAEASVWKDSVVVECVLMQSLELVTTTITRGDQGLCAICLRKALFCSLNQTESSLIPVNSTGFIAINE